MRDRGDIGAARAEERGGARADPDETRPRAPGREEELKSKKEELLRITQEVRAAKRGAGIPEQVEQLKRAKRKQQEIFRLKGDLRAAREGRGGPGTGSLPDFALIGAPKCGTTFLYHLLTKHPDVEPAACKEPHYFDLLFEEGVDWYRHCFPAPRREGARGPITGEATPTYLYHPDVPERMAGVVPHARLIALLRDPVERVHSAYHHRVRNGKEKRTFEEFVQASLEDPKRRHLSQGVYVDHLSRWSGFFGTGRMLVLTSEALSDDPRGTLRRVLGFLGLPDWEPEGSALFDKRNEGGYEEKMDPALRRRLEGYFEPHNRKLYEFLGTDLGW